MTEWNKRTRSMQGIGKKRWTSMEKRQNCLCGWKNLHTKQLEKILQENYELVDIGHPEQQQMMDLIKRNYCWPEIKNNVKRYI